MIATLFVLTARPSVHPSLFQHFSQNPCSWPHIVLTLFITSLTGGRKLLVMPGPLTHRPRLGGHVMLLMFHEQPQWVQHSQVSHQVCIITHPPAGRSRPVLRNSQVLRANSNLRACWCVSGTGARLLVGHHLGRAVWPLCNELTTAWQVCADAVSVVALCMSLESSRVVWRFPVNSCLKDSLHDRPPALSNDCFSPLCNSSFSSTMS